jgi:sugar/nucleoside kinase (ribokinase family)
VTAYDLVVVGELNADVVFAGTDPTPVFGQAEQLVESGALTVGGSSAIAACGAARLGLRTAFVVVVGDDELGRFLLEALRTRGVDVSHAIVDPHLATGISVILNRGASGDRAILTAPGTIATLEARHVPRELLAGTRHVHSAGYYLQPGLRTGLPALFAEARSHGATTSLDTNWDPEGRWDGVGAVLAATDLFLPNRQELLRIAGARTVEEALAALRRPGLAIAVKLGEEGALLSRDGETVRADAPAVDVVDAIGAGDSFDAGCIYGFLQGWPAERTLALAVACGSLSTRAHGGTEAQATLEEATL